eukprot:CAMPEP_0203753142 /NCGR_PEP_ID=MMETSP0098-20131031/6949_1 /ASSEMBLY_ACC=CAM_ASM_000208 /TAXON_ID=96639 /ORGANISM=" , Strain NY0313808BC1" /LENGTH=584 /DNA_ID=CAMNT_0050643605 /DNA_START=312 /DNA_END=2066 /DNA_ORIENTATION=+
MEMGPVGNDDIKFRGSINRGTSGETRIEDDSVPSVVVTVVDAQACPFRNGAVGSGRTITFNLKKGNTVWVTGPSGTGKTSLLKALFAASESSADGFVNRCDKLGFETQLFGYHPENGKVRMLYQEAALIDSLTVEENLMLALSLGSDTPKSERLSILKGHLARTGLEHTSRLLSKYPSHLSLGMRRRVALSVMLCQSPSVLLLDEVFASLDDHSARTTALKIRELQESTGLCVVLVSHLPEFAKLLKPGEELNIVPNEEYHTSETNASLVEQFVTRLRLHGGLHIFQRAWADFVRLMIFSMPLCFFAGGLVGAGFMGLLGSILKYVHADTLLKAMPDSVKSNGMFNLIKGKIAKVGEDVIESGKPKVIGAGMSYVFSIEIGPLIVGMLMAGILGSALGGRVATLQATEQDTLLSTLGYGKKTWLWTLVPSLIAAMFGAPLLFFACFRGLIHAGILSLDPANAGSHEVLWTNAMQAFWDHNLNGGYRWDRGVFSYPPVIALYRTIGFMVAVVIMSELVTRLVVPSRSARQVSFAIASSVMASFIAVLFMEFLFSRLLILSLNMPDPENLKFDFNMPDLAGLGLGL